MSFNHAARACCRTVLFIIFVVGNSTYATFANSVAAKGSKGAKAAPAPKSKVVKSAPADDAAPKPGAPKPGAPHAAPDKSGSQSDDKNRAGKDASKSRTSDPKPGKAQESLPPKQRAKLERGEVLMWTQPVKGFDLPKVHAKVLLAGDVTKTWKIISDCRNLKRIVPAVEQIKVQAESPQGQRCWMLVGAPWPFSDLKSVLQYRHSGGANAYTMTFKLVEGDYRRNRGYWRLSPYGDKTLVRYWLHSIPTTRAPDSVISWGTKRNVRTMFKRLIREAKSSK